MKEFIKKYRVALICATLIFAAGMLNGVMDTLQFHYAGSPFPKGEETFLGQKEIYWNPSISWKNKYKDYPSDQRPKFFLSTTWLVSLTDAWHLLKTLMLFCFHGAILYSLIHYYKWPRWILFALVMPLNLFFGLAFTIMYAGVLTKKEGD